MNSRNILVAILTLAFILRIVGITYGLPLTVVADEPAHLYGALQMLETSTLIPGLHPNEFLQKLYFPPYLSYIFLPFIVVVLGIWFIFSHISIDVFKLILALDPSYLFLTIRFLSVLAGTITVYLVYKAAKNIFNEEKPALLAATVLALSFLHVNFSHWGRHWSFVTLIFTLIIWALSRADVSLKYKYLSTALLTGIGFGINYQAGIAAVFILLWFLFIDKISFLRAIRAKWVWEVVTCFVILIGIVVALYPQNLSVISPASVARYSIDEPAGLYGFLWSYYFYLKQLFLAEPAFLLAFLIGIITSLRNNVLRRFTLISIIFISIYIAVFYFVFHLQGRYILMLYPLLAIIAGFGLSKIWKWPALVLLAMMFITALRFDQLLIKNDTRVQAREWIFEHVSEQTKVAVLARLARLPSTPEAITEQELLDRESLRKIDQAERTLPPELQPLPQYHALNLGTVKGELFSSLPEYLRSHNYEYMLVSPEFTTSRATSLNQLGNSVSKFEGYDESDDINDLTNGFGGGLPFLFSGRSNGPTIEILRIR